MNRRKFIKSSMWGLAGLGIVSGFYAWQIEPFWLEFVRLKMPIKHLPNHLVGKTLMQISDIHIGNRFDYRFIIDSFKKAKEFDPDFVVYTGDYINLYKDKVQYDKLKEVLENCVIGKLGTVGILGNHDYGIKWSEAVVADQVTTMLSDHGIHVLRNKQIEISDLNIIGLDDYWGLNFNPKMVMSEYNASKPCVLLCHNPDVCDLDVWNNYEGWILSGHTHGGQVKPPFLPPPILPIKNYKYAAGRIELEKNRTLYVNRALGHLWQVRFNVRPEITIFELVHQG